MSSCATPEHNVSDLAAFATTVTVPSEARHVAQTAWIDTLGVILAGSTEPAARIVQGLCVKEGGYARCRILGTSLRTSTASAAMANGTAAHALDYDDTCFVSLAHPSAPLVAATLAIGELAGASGRELLDAYVVGFEIECALGRVANPWHYDRGWHCTSTLGSIGAAAAAARLLHLDATQATHALSLAASQACGVKENFGTMAKPLHAGLAARNAVTAVLLAADGCTASADGIDGPQGFVAATSGAVRPRSDIRSNTGWEILRTGITVKQYPSCAATHPTLDALIALQRTHGFHHDSVQAIDVTVDPVVPSVLIHPRARTGLEAKFSMPFCSAAAVVLGTVDITAFDEERLTDPAIRRLAARVTMHVDESLLAAGPPLTQARVAVKLTDSRTLTAQASGARGYPDAPLTTDELNAKFRGCARRIAMSDAWIDATLSELHRLEAIGNLRLLSERLSLFERRGP